MALYDCARAVLHGLDMAGTFAQRPLKAHDGATFYANDLFKLLVYDAQLRTWFAADGDAIYDASENYLCDLFRGDAIDTQYALTNGADGQAVDPVIDVDAVGGGAVVGVTGNVGDGYTNDGSQLCAAATYISPEDGTTIFGCRFQIADVASCAFFLGLTDVVTFEEPMSLDTATYTTTATNAVGFLFDTTATTDTIRCCGVADGTDATHVDSSVEPVANTYNEFAMEISTAGVAKMYIDGTLITTLTGAIAADADVAPIVCGTARSAASDTWTCNLLCCHQDG